MGFLNKLLGRDDKAEFAKMLIKRADQQYGIGSQLRYDAAGFAIVRDDGSGDPNKLHLHNIYPEYQSLSKSDRELGISTWIALLLGAQVETKDFAAIKDLLMPSVRPAFVFDFMTKSVQAGRIKDDGKTLQEVEVPLEYYKLHNDLALCFLIDQPTTVQMVSREMIQGWDKTYEELYEIALANLLKATPERSYEQIMPGLYLGDWHDTYDASRILLPEMFRLPDLKGMPVVLMVNRNEILVAGSADTTALEAMLEAAKIAFQQPRAYYTLPLFLSGDTWKKFEVTADHAFFDTLKEFERLIENAIYADQQATLDMWLEAQGIDIFVATQNLWQTAEGFVYTGAAWGPVVSYIPKAEYIHFANENGIICNVSWKTVREKLSDLMEDTDFDPPRYLVRDLPPAERMAELSNELRGTK